MPNGIILGYSVVLERYEDGSGIGSLDVDANTFAVEFDDSQSIRKLFNVTLIILYETYIMWAVANVSFVMKIC